MTVKPHADTHTSTHTHTHTHLLHSPEPRPVVERHESHVVLRLDDGCERVALSDRRVQDRQLLREARRERLHVLLQRVARCHVKTYV